MARMTRVEADKEGTRIYLAFYDVEQDVNADNYGCAVTAALHKLARYEDVMDDPAVLRRKLGELTKGKQDLEQLRKSYASQGNVVLSLTRERDELRKRVTYLQGKAAQGDLGTLLWTMAVVERMRVELGELPALCNYSYRGGLEKAIEILQKAVVERVQGA